MEDWSNFKVGDTICFSNSKGRNKSFVYKIIEKSLITIDKHNLYIYKDFIKIRNVNNSKNLLIEKTFFKVEEEFF